MHFFLQKSARHQKDFFKTDHFKASQQKEPGPSYIRALFDKEPRVYAQEPFDEESEQFQEKTLQLLVPNNKRLGGYIQMGVLFSSKRYTPRKDLTKRYTVSIKKALRRCLFLLNETCRNKTRLLELNHEVLEGLSVWDPRDTSYEREN